MVYGESVTIDTGVSDMAVALPLVPYQDLAIHTILGAGGFGSVHFGLLGDEPVAVKRTHQRCEKQQAFTDSLMAEITASTLRHVNIVRVLGICTDHDFVEDLPLLIMEYAGDRNLQTLVEDPQQVIDTTRRLRFATDITRALEFAHSRGILHLDVKLANVIVTQDDHCKLADFGCSQSSPSNKPDTPTKSQMTGTFAYRAPELLRGRAPSDKADVYSLAICLWQLMTRERPYGYEEHQVIVFAVVAQNQRPDLPKAIDSDVDQVYCDLFQQAWHADPQERPSSKALLRSLNELQNEATGS